MKNKFYIPFFSSVNNKFIEETKQSEISEKYQLVNYNFKMIKTESGSNLYIELYSDKILATKYFYVVKNINTKQIQILNINHPNLLWIYDIFDDEFLKVHNYTYGKIVPNEMLNTHNFPNVNLESYLYESNIDNKKNINISKILNILENCKISFDNFEKILSGNSTINEIEKVIKFIVSENYLEDTEFIINSKIIIDNIITEVNYLNQKQSFNPIKYIKNYIKC